MFYNGSNKTEFAIQLEQIPTVVLLVHEDRLDALNLSPPPADPATGTGTSKTAIKATKYNKTLHDYNTNINKNNKQVVQYIYLDTIKT
jgi:hypothetical protein